MVRLDFCAHQKKTKQNKTQVLGGHLLGKNSFNSMIVCEIGGKLYFSWGVYVCKCKSTIKSVKLALRKARGRLPPPGS